MRMLGWNTVAEEVLCETWATDRVRVFASWPALCLVVYSDLGGVGSQDVNNVVSVRSVGRFGCVFRVSCAFVYMVLFCLFLPCLAWCGYNILRLVGEQVL